MKPHFSVYKPTVFSRFKYKKTFQKKHPNIFFVDAFSSQIRELFFINHPHLVQQDKKEVYQSNEFRRYARLKENSYVYVFYPWNNHLVKTVTAADYFRLKTNRNRDLITPTEQKRLAAYRVAVLGMSVGSNIAFVLTQAGISRNIVLADFDELATTNLNRVLGGVHQIGLNKCVLAARRIYEDNPFAEVTILPKGVTEQNLRNLLDRQKIDCLIDEIDFIPMKIAIRRLALQYQVPVLMVTDNGDGIVLHIERYDLGYRKILHKNTAYWDKKLELFASEKHSEKKIAGGIIMDDIVGGVHLVDPAMLRSVRKVLSGKLVSWSQLGSAAILGGVYVTCALKRIILGKEKRKEVRAYIWPRF